MSKFYVYIYFRINGEPCYVGKGSGYRLNVHEYQCSNPYLKNIIAKEGPLPRVKIREDLTEAQAFETEIALIAAIGRKRYGGPLVNLSDGGEGPIGWQMSEAHRQIIINKMTGRTISEKTRLKYSAIHKGKIISEAQKLLVSAKLKGVKKPDGMGAKVSAALKGKSKLPASEETKAKMRAAHIRRWAERKASQGISF